jgi:hypothetical protein
VGIRRKLRGGIFMKKPALISVLILTLVFSLLVPVQSAVANHNTSLILPVQGLSQINYGNIQNSFPNVDWNTIDRIYVPAGQYIYMRIGNLPDRSANDPLIITNYGGQVIIGEEGTPLEDRHHYAMWLGGGSNWVLTGKYDPVRETGHPNFIGHMNGDYANSEGTYGFEVSHTGSNGVKISEEATNFELEYMEVAHTDFAGLNIKTDGAELAVMDGVKIHDLYIHDNEAEGIYIGNTSKDANAQHKFTNLELYNNRIVRNGAEGLQLGHLGGGSEIYNNVVLLSALDWKDPFQDFQSGAFQLTVRDGNIDIHHNIIIGGGGSLFNLFILARTEEPNAEVPAQGEVFIHDNYFSHSRSLFAYLNNPSPEQNTTSTLRMENNWISDVDFHYDEIKPQDVDTNTLLEDNDPSNDIFINNNKYQGNQVFIEPINGANGNVGNYSASGNQNVSIDNIQFMDTTFPSNFNYSLLERWTDKSDVYGVTIEYEVGDYVIHEGLMYTTTQNHGAIGNEPGVSNKWTLVPWMTDDLRLHANSPFQGFGLLDTPTGNVDPNPPSAVTNLSAAGPTSSSVNLSWSATGDDANVGIANYYDIRYSTSSITSANWNSATPVTGEPNPASPGTNQTMTVSGLSANTTYYFAMNVADEVNNMSGLSNVASATTTPGAQGSAKLTLTTSMITNETGYGDATMIVDEQSTAGDPRDGTGGAPVTYWDPGYQTGHTPAYAYIDLGQLYNIDDVYLRDYTSTGNFIVYSGSPGNWTQLISEPCTNYQTWKAHDVNVQTRYLRFHKTVNSANISEVVLYGSPASDTTAPAAITNLSVGSPTISSVQLSWTAPGDDLNTGTAASYDIRYSTSNITSANWNNATPISGEPTPAIAGTNQSKTVNGLSPSTTYYFAMKTTDDVNLTSGLSNVAQGTTAGSQVSSKLTLTTSMITNETGYGDATMLVDEQSAAGDPRDGVGGSPTSYWDPGYQTGHTPAYAYIDLGQVYNIDDIYLRDYTSTGNFIVYTGSPGNWTQLISEPCTNYQTWKPHDVNVQTRYLRFHKTVNSANISEVVLYGSPN